MVITKEIEDMLVRADAVRSEIGYQGTVAEMLTDGLCIFVARHHVAKVERAEKLAGRPLR